MPYFLMGQSGRKLLRCDISLKLAYRDLAYKKYLVTGASSGLGLAICRQLLKIPGTKITAVARNTAVLSQMDKARVYAQPLDVTIPQNVEAMLDKAMEHMQGIDCIITCAGFGYYESFEGKSHEHINKIFQTNVISPLYTLERFLAKTKGEITFVAISSMLGKFGLPGMALYSATKHALDGFFDSYRYEKPKRLTYITAYPIGLKTEFWQRIGNDIPLPKPLQSVDVAAFAILRAIGQKKKRAYTSPMARVALNINRLIPLLVPAYQHISKRKYDNWLRNRPNH